VVEFLAHQLFLVVQVAVEAAQVTQTELRELPTRVAAVVVQTH
jgi:hypothetical protein